MFTLIALFFRLVFYVLLLAGAYFLFQYVNNKYQEANKGSLTYNRFQEGKLVLDHKTITGPSTEIYYIPDSRGRDLAPSDLALAAPGLRWFNMDGTEVTGTEEHRAIEKALTFASSSGFLEADMRSLNIGL